MRIIIEIRVVLQYTDLLVYTRKYDATVSQRIILQGKSQSEVKYAQIPEGKVLNPKIKQ